MRREPDAAEREMGMGTSLGLIEGIGVDLEYASAMMACGMAFVGALGLAIGYLIGRTR